MTDLFTCSYRMFEGDMGQPVVCSLTRPRWPGPYTETFAQAPTCYPVTPRWTYFKQPDAGEKFEAQLARYGAGEIAKDLQRIALEYRASSLVLLCHEVDWGTIEAPKCHRLRVARFLLETTGWMVRELGDRLPPPEGSLF